MEARKSRRRGGARRPWWKSALTRGCPSTSITMPAVTSTVSPSSHVRNDIVSNPSYTPPFRREKGVRTHTRQSRPVLRVPICGVCLSGQKSYLPFTYPAGHRLLDIDLQV